MHTYGRVQILQHQKQNTNKEHIGEKRISMTFEATILLRRGSLRRVRARKPLGRT